MPRKATPTLCVGGDFFGKDDLTPLPDWLSAKIISLAEQEDRPVCHQMIRILKTYFAGTGSVAEQIISDLAKAKPKRTRRKKKEVMPSDSRLSEGNGVAAGGDGSIAITSPPAKKRHRGRHLQPDSPTCDYPGCTAQSVTALSYDADHTYNMCQGHKRSFGPDGPKLPRQEAHEQA